MSLNDQLESVILKRGDDSLLLGSDDSLILGADDDDFVRPPRKEHNEDLEMDITPMIDITFLLLIFFLVTSRPDETTAILLPKAQHGDAVSQRFSTILSVGEGGLDQPPVYKGDGKFPRNELSSDPETRAEQIQDYIEQGIQEGKTDVVIKADRGVSCGNIDGVLKAVSKVDGITINLGVLESR